jgi:hypothetical protein
MRVTAFLIRQNSIIGDRFERRYGTNCYPNYTVIDVVILLFYLCLLLQLKGELIFLELSQKPNRFLRSKDIIIFVFALNEYNLYSQCNCVMSQISDFHDL